MVYFTTLSVSETSPVGHRMAEKLMNNGKDLERRQYFSAFQMIRVQNHSHHVIEIAKGDVYEVLFALLWRNERKRNCDFMSQLYNRKNLQRIKQETSSTSCVLFCSL
jgi:hypothetical protein